MRGESSLAQRRMGRGERRLRGGWKGCNAIGYWKYVWMILSEKGCMVGDEIVERRIGSVEWGGVREW